MDAGKIGRADHSSIVNQLRDEEFRFRVVAARGQVLQVRLADRIDEQVAGNCDATTDDKTLRVEYSTERCTGLAKPAAEFCERVDGPRVTRGNTDRSSVSALSCDL